MVTWVIEDKNNVLLGYPPRLKDAKEWALEIGEGAIITKMVGQYKYEGFHHYYLTLVNGKFVKTYTHWGKK